jgi:hypothetical protein
MNKNQNNKQFIPSRQFVRQNKQQKTRPYIEQIVRSKPKQNVLRKTKRGSFDLNNIFTDILNTFTKAASNPTVLLTFAVALSIIVNHDFDKKTGYIFSTFSGKQDGFSTWVHDNAKKICGMLIFLPTILDIPKDKRAVVAIASFLWVFMIPEYLFIEYLIQSLLLHTYFKVTNRNTRIVILLFAVLAWFSGFITFNVTNITSAKNSTKTH